MTDQYPDLIEYESQAYPRILQFLLANKLPVICVSLGIFFVSASFMAFRTGLFEKEEEFEVITTNEVEEEEILVEVSGAVKKPGVFQFKLGDRIEDAIQMAGGYTDEVDISWTQKNINRASKLADGQKIYIPKINEQSIPASATNERGGTGSSSYTQRGLSSLININTASLSELESLWGIGPSVGQKVIDQRPYSKVEELLERKVVSKNVFEKIKDQISVY